MTSSSTHLPPRLPSRPLTPGSLNHLTATPPSSAWIPNTSHKTARESPRVLFFCTTYRRVLGIRLAHARSDVGCETGPRTRGQFTRSHRTRRRRRSEDSMRRRVNPRQHSSVAPRGCRAHHAVMCCRSQLQAVAVFGIPAVSPQHDGYVAVPPCQWLSCCYGTSPVVAALDRRRHK